MEISTNTRLCFYLPSALRACTLPPGFENSFASPGAHLKNLPSYLSTVRLSCKLAAVANLCLRLHGEGRKEPHAKHHHDEACRGPTLTFLLAAALQGLSPPP